MSQYRFPSSDSILGKSVKKGEVKITQTLGSQK